MKRWIVVLLAIWMPTAVFAEEKKTCDQWLDSFRENVNVFIDSHSMTRTLRALWLMITSWERSSVPTTPFSTWFTPLHLFWRKDRYPQAVIR
jgi:hypothetical protein